MSSKINRVPWGLQDFLGNTNAGENPGTVPDEVRAIFDMWPLWGMERLSAFRASGTMTVRGDSIALTVPDNELWMPYTVAWQVNGAGGVGNHEIRLGAFHYPFQDNPNVPMYIKSGDPWNAVAIGDLHTWNWTPGFPVVWNSGLDIRIDASVTPPAAHTANLYVHAWRLFR